MKQDGSTQNNFVLSLNLSASDQNVLQQAIFNFTYATQINSDDSDTYVLLSLSLHRRCHPKIALLTYKHAILLNPHHATIHIIQVIPLAR